MSSTTADCSQVASRANHQPTAHLPTAHLPVLDGIRGVAILLVILMHFTSNEIDPHLDSGPWIERLWAKVAICGSSGVDLFFVLSGFLITRILVTERGSPRYLGNFYMRRLLRIFPLYYLALFLAFVIAPLLGASITSEVSRVREHQIWMWTYTSNIASSFFGVDWDGGWLALSHFWSLAVEEHFYLLWPLLVLWISPHRLIWASLLIIVLAIVSKIIFLHDGMIYAVYQLTPCRLDAVSMGAALAIIDRERGGLASLRGIAQTTLLVTAGFTAVLAIVSHTSPLLWWTTAIVHTNWAVFYAAFLIIALESRPTGVLGTVLVSPTLRFFGRYSYGLYVFHYMLRPTFVSWLHPDRIQSWVGSRILGLWIFGALAGSISVGIALISWNVFEKHFLKLKHRFSHSAKRRPMECTPVLTPIDHNPSVGSGRLTDGTRGS